MAYGAILGQSNLQPNNFWSLDSTGTTIPAGSDLNDYTNPGNYNSFGVTVSSSTYENCPVSNVFIMKVYLLSSSDVAQWLQTFNQGATYWRYRSSEGVWTDWKQYVGFYQYSTSDLQAGTSPLATGSLYLVYE